MKNRTLIILSGGVVLLIILLLVGFFVVAPAITAADNTRSVTPTVTATPSTPTTNKPKVQLQKVMKQYAPQMLNQIAQGLHMTPQQLKAQLQSGKTLSQIATTQNVSATQLQTIETSAVQGALQQAVNSGTLTQKQATAIAKRLQKDPQVLERILKA